MKKHKYIDPMHCADCFDKTIKRINKYESSPEAHERRRNEALVNRYQMRAIEHNFMHKTKHADCEFCYNL